MYSKPNPEAEKTIKKDLHRTMPEVMKEHHIEQLHHILLAYANMDTKVKYCQGKHQPCLSLTCTLRASQA